MREYAIVKKQIYIKSPVEYILKKVEIHEEENGDLMTYLYDAVDETLFHNDLILGNLEDTKEYCLKEYGIELDDWIAVDEHTK